jgi:hypothetical protein
MGNDTPPLPLLAAPTCPSMARSTCRTLSHLWLSSIQNWQISTRLLDTSMSPLPVSVFRLNVTRDDELMINHSGLCLGLACIDEPRDSTHSSSPLITHFRLFHLSVRACFRDLDRHDAHRLSVQNGNHGMAFDQYNLPRYVISSRSYVEYALISAVRSCACPQLPSTAGSSRLVLCGCRAIH